MSAPETNVEKQEKRHRGALLGIPVAIVMASLAFIAVIAYVSLSGDDAEDVTPAAASEEDATGTATESE